MKFKQRICGYNGHVYKVEVSRDILIQRITNARLICTKCGYQSEWFPISFTQKI